MNEKPNAKLELDKKNKILFITTGGGKENDRNEKTVNIKERKKERGT